MLAFIQKLLKSKSQANDSISNSAETAKLKDLGIASFFESHGNEKLFAFYIKRPFGNLLIYKIPTLLHHFEYFKSQGGIWKQFDELGHFRGVSESLFKIFGAANVSSEIIPEDRGYPTETFGHDFADVYISTVRWNTHNHFVFYQNKIALMFAHPSLSIQEFIHAQKKGSLTDPVLSSIDYFFFHRVADNHRAYISKKEIQALKLE